MTAHSLPMMGARRASSTSSTNCSTTEEVSIRFVASSLAVLMQGAMYELDVQQQALVGISLVFLYSASTLKPSIGVTTKFQLWYRTAWL